MKKAPRFRSPASRRPSHAASRACVAAQPVRAIRVAAGQTPRSTLTPKQVIEQVAHPGTDDYHERRRDPRHLPERLRAFAYIGRIAAAQLIFALTLDADAERAREAIAHRGKVYYDAATRAGVEETRRRTVASLHPLQRLPLAQLAFPALRRRPRPQLQTFLIALNQLIQADGRVAARGVLPGQTDRACR